MLSRQMPIAAPHIGNLLFYTGRLKVSTGAICHNLSLGSMFPMDERRPGVMHPPHVVLRGQWMALMECLVTKDRS